MIIKNIKLYKIKLRKKFRRRREDMPPILKDAKNKKILKKLCLLQKYKSSNIVFIYVSKNIEVDTYSIMEKCWEDGKKVAVPRCNTQDKSMDFYIINSTEDLEKGAFGLLEPIKEKCEKVVDFSQGLCIVPGFCFDYTGYRLGYGHGYYDRFLTNFGGTSVGICYSDFIIPALPHGRFDKVVDFLVTDKYIKQFGNN